MRDILREIRSLLYASPDLLSKLGGKRVYILKAPEGSEYPRIVLTEISINDTDYMDDEPSATDYTVQVSIFDKKETLALFNAVDPILKADGYRRLPSAEMYEEDEQIYHRPLRYRIKIMKEDTT